MTSDNERIRREAEIRMAAAAEELSKQITINDGRSPECRVPTLTRAVSSGSEFLVLNGSAHLMEPLFVALMRQRPELRQVMQNAINSSYRTVNL